jgi:hypothetical protein
MARTSAAEVILAIDTDLTTDQIGGYIETANLWVTENLAGDGLSDSLLTQIEKYLSCHFVTLRDPRIRSTQVGDVAETYQRDTRLTEYLKAAAALDSTGKVEDQFMRDKGRQRFEFRAGDGFAS